MNSTVERELKLTPGDPKLLDQLAALDRFGSLIVHGRRHQLQRNAFFDNAALTLGKAGIGFRRRVIQNEPMAVWSLKGNSKFLKGVATRSEIELQLDADLAPALAVSALEAAARARGAPELAEAVADGLSSGGLPLAQPLLESETDRTILDLVEPARDWSVELALDRVHLIGHRYAEIEIEAELKRGEDTALDEIRAAIEAMGEVRDSKGSKLSRAIAHVRDCHCVKNSAPT